MSNNRFPQSPPAFCEWQVLDPPLTPCLWCCWVEGAGGASRICTTEDVGVLLFAEQRLNTFRNARCLSNCYYRPQTRFAKVMFLHMSVCPQGGVSKHADTPSTGRLPSRHLPPGRHPWSDIPLRIACWEIRSTSGRYASYWNAILLQLTLSWCRRFTQCYSMINFN